MPNSLRSSLPKTLNAPNSSEWAKPEEWPDLSQYASGRSYFIGSLAIFPSVQQGVSLRLTCAAAVIIDWGDGTAQTVYPSVATTYSKTYDFKTLKGAPTSNGYKIAVISATCATAGITLINLTFAWTGQGGGALNPSNWLDILIHSPELTTLGISNINAPKPYLERVCILGGTSMSSWNDVFSYSRALRVVELEAGGKAATFNNTFEGCDRLQSVSLGNYSLVTQWQYTFRYCTELKKLPFNYLNLPGAGSIVNLFYLSGIEDASFVLLNCDDIGATNQNGLFYNCLNLKRITNVKFNGTAQNFCALCYNLEEIVDVELTSTTTTNAFQNCFKLKRAKMKIHNSFSVGNSDLGASALNELFTELPTVSSKTVTITNAPGSATCDRSIATAKGWTVTG